MKKNYYCYRATVVFSGCTQATDEKDAIRKVIADSERLPESLRSKLENYRKNPKKDYITIQSTIGEKLDSIYTLKIHFYWCP